MLIVTRRIGERLYIKAPNGDKIVIWVLKSTYPSTTQTRMGILAPIEYQILREELILRDEELCKEFFKEEKYEIYHD